VAVGGEHPHGTVVMRRLSDTPYQIAYEVAPLSEVAKHTRDLDDGFLAGDNDVTPAFLDYVRPLVGELPRPGRLSDFPLS
jgi:ATP-dependent phosphofructokinase / diphosphate-dependent phosphofructokinase